MRLLLVEDDENIASLLKASLESETFSVDWANDGEMGSYLCRTNEYDLVILDYALPKKDGKKVCSEVRESGKKMPIIMLTANANIESKIDLLNTGVDDYLTKPFSFQELLARIRALLRRPQLLHSTTLQIGNLKLDTIKQKAARGKKLIYLTRKEFALLEYLMRHQSIVVSRGMIMEHVWDAESDPFSNTIEAHILNLRKKIDGKNKQKFIHTVPGRGYTIDLPQQIQF